MITLKQFELFKSGDVKLINTITEKMDKIKKYLMSEYSENMEGFLASDDLIVFMNNTSYVCLENFDDINELNIRSLCDLYFVGLNILDQKGFIGFLSKFDSSLVEEVNFDFSFEKESDFSMKFPNLKDLNICLNLRDTEPKNVASSLKNRYPKLNKLTINYKHHFRWS